MFSKKLFNNNQNSSGGGSGGPTNWGSIGGDINNQIDLKGQLNDKADKSELQQITQELSTKADVSQLNDKADVSQLNDKANKSELPAIATNNNVGLVKPDGTSITITNDGTISSVGGGGTDTNFVPAGTILTVKTDGSGQFTQLSEAINYLTNKWSNGTVTIQLGEGAFDSLTYTTSSSIPSLVIKGVSQSATTITSVYLTGNGFCQLIDLSVESTKAPAVYAYDSVHLICKGVKMSVPNATSNVVMAVRHLARVNVDTCIFHSDTKGGTGFYLNTGVPIGIYGKCTFENLNNAAYVQYGGILCNMGSNTYTNITNKTNKDYGYSTSDGVIYGKTE